MTQEEIEKLITAKMEANDKVTTRFVQFENKMKKMHEDVETLNRQTSIETDRLLTQQKQEYLAFPVIKKSTFN